MTYSTEGISRVRLRPLVLDLRRGEPLAAGGAFEVTWASEAAGRWHQVYVNGRRAGVTAAPEDRRLVVSAPVAGGGPLAAVLVEVVAVDAADRGTDLAQELTGFAASRGRRLRLLWQAGPHLDPNLESFDVYADGRTGSVDYDSPLNEEPLPARPGGATPWGYGCGGYGGGAFGQGAALYEWVTDELEPGPWRLAVVAADAAGNRLATAAEVEAEVAPLARPPTGFRLASYDPLSRCAKIAWDPSPDL